MKKCLVAVFALTALVCAAAPKVTVSSVAQDAESRMVTVGYALENAPAIITLGMETNRTGAATEDPADWIAVDEGSLQRVWGDVNKIVRSDGAAYQINWRPDFSWPYHTFAANAARAVVKAWTLDDPPDYAVFNLAAGGDPAFYTDLKALPGGVSDDVYKTDCLVMRRVHATGVPWRRGSPFTEANRRYTNDQHIEDPFMCVLSSDYYLGVFELTVHQYDRITGVVPSGDGLRKPILHITWNNCRGDSSGDNNWPTKGHAVSAASVMGKLRGVTGQEFDLPTASQWEFACRAGCTAAYSNGGQAAADGLPAGWFSENASGSAHDAGERAANSWGFYDMHGNASEWVLDWVSNYPMNYDHENGPDAAPQDHIYMTGLYRMVKGGGFAQAVGSARSASVSAWSVATGYTDQPAQIGCRVCMPAVIQH
ncbi:MAG: SUMF1/EgtB/PvdO family nonheme iron enzyme [Kiritimatiellae bacterium]|nr:SUMF1/EgtB/PvdO family nonheme iron enzyme [Kiritimatiellia bacterium]